MKNGCDTLRALVVLCFVFAFSACGGEPVAIKADTPSGNGGSVGNGGNGGSGECCNGNGERLTRQYLVGDDGSKMETPVWHDNMLDLNCSFQSLPNGQTYCVPPHEVMNTYFDSGCVIPAYIRVVLKDQPLDACDKFPSHVRYGQYKHAGLCGTQGSDDFTIFRVNPDKLIARAPAYYEKDGGGTCKIVDFSANPFQDVSIWEVLEIGPLVDFVKAVSGVGF